MKKKTCGLGDPTEGLHDAPLERIYWNAHEISNACERGGHARGDG